MPILCSMTGDPHRSLKLSTALRLDKVESVDVAVSPKVSVLFGPMANVNLRASIGRAFHAPTIQELYEQGYGHGGRAYRDRMAGDVLIRNGVGPDRCRCPVPVRCLCSAV